MRNRPVFYAGPKSPQCNCYSLIIGIAAHTVLERCKHPLSSEQKCWNVALDNWKFLFHSKSPHNFMMHAKDWLLLLIQTDRHCSVLRKSPVAAKQMRISRGSSCWLPKAFNHRICARALLFLLLERQLCLHFSQTCPKQTNKIISIVVIILFHTLISKQIGSWWLLWPHAVLALWMNRFQNGLRLVMWKGGKSTPNDWQSCLRFSIS